MNDLDLERDRTDLAGDRGTGSCRPPLVKPSSASTARGR